MNGSVFCLGSVDISSQPDKCAAEVKERQISFRQFFKAGENTSESPDLMGEKINEIQFSVNIPVISLRISSVGTLRNNRYNSEALQILPERTAVAAFVRRKGGNRPSEFQLV